MTDYEVEDHADWCQNGLKFFRRKCKEQGLTIEATKAYRIIYRAEVAPGIYFCYGRDHFEGDGDPKDRFRVCFFETIHEDEVKLPQWITQDPEWFPGMGP